MRARRDFLGQSKDDHGVVAVVEFLSAFTLFLMILTAFMSLAQLELGSNNPETDLIDRSAVEGLERLTNGEGWFVPIIDETVRDYQNATSEWHNIPPDVLYSGQLQPGIVSNGVLDMDKVSALSNVSLDSMVKGLGLDSDLSLRLVIKVEESDVESRAGNILFEGGSDRNTSKISSYSSRSFTNQNEVISVSLEVHEGASTPSMLRITEISPRPQNNGPEWIEVQNQNGFALSLYGWSFERGGTTGSMSHLYTEGVVPGGDLVLFSGDPSSQDNGNATIVYDLGYNGFLGIGSVDGLSDSAGRLKLLFAEKGSSFGTEICHVEWDNSLQLGFNDTIIWNGGPPHLQSSWNLSTNPSPGQV